MADRKDRFHPGVYQAQDQLKKGRMSRREFLRLATLLGVSLPAAQVLAACGAPTTGMGVPEDAPLKLNGIYAISKYFEERLTLSLGREWGIPAVALRYSLTYGPRQSIFNAYSGICSIFSTRLLNGQPPVLYEDGRQTRDFVFVQDVARANVAALEDSRFDYQVFNVGTGKGTTVYEFAGLLRDAYSATRNDETD